MALTITTYTGAHFAPTEPAPEGVRIQDVAHALSLLCRGNGHVKQFFSVGQHCLHCAREAKARGWGSRVALACLLHDASEAYLSDVPRPFKASLPEYRVLEDRLLAVIYQKFLGSPLTAREAALVKQVDPGLTIHDFRVVRGTTHDNLIFDAVLPFSSSKTPAQAAQEIRALVRAMDGNYYAVVTVEHSYTD